MKRLEIDGRIVQRALLSAPIKNADPFERQGPYGGLMGLALVALLLVVRLRPEGMPYRLRRPCDELCQRNVGHWRRPCTQDFWPLRSVPGTLSAYYWSSMAEAERARCWPKATSSRGAKTGPGFTVHRWSTWSVAMFSAVIALMLELVGL